MTDKKLIVITGPTASGKSALAIELARKIGTEIISADSRQIYQGLPIVTAQPSAEEMAGIPHHLINILPLDAYYSAAEFEMDALRIATDIFKKNDTAIVCGGSMMYVDALCHGIDLLPTIKPELRDSLKQEHAEMGDDWLLQKLELLDPLTFRRIDKKNIKRVFHAVEISIQAGKPYSELLTGKRKTRDFRIIKVCIDISRLELFCKINSRVDRMFDDGLEEEVRGVWHLKGLNSLNTVGVKEMFSYFEGSMTLEEAKSRIKKNTRVYAKKQLTWYARDTQIIKMAPEGAIHNIIDLL